MLQPQFRSTPAQCQVGDAMAVEHVPFWPHLENVDMIWQPLGIGHRFVFRLERMGRSGGFAWLRHA